MNPLLIKLLSSTWLLHSDNPEVYGAMVVSMLRGDRTSDADFSAARAAHKPYFVSTDQGRTVTGQMGPVVPGSVAVIPIKGTLTKDDQECGPMGTVSLTNSIKQCDADPSVKSILLYVDSPGGSSSYMDILSQTIAQCQTPVIAFVEGMAASAAYWAISGAKKIICSSPTDQVGSIGTYLTWYDLKGYMEAHGVAVHEVYATLSTEKNQIISDLRSGNEDRVKSDFLDRINSQFHSQVQANRPAVDPATLHGKIYFASDAIAVGLIDEIGSMESAMNCAHSYPEKKSTIQNNSKNPTMTIKMLAAWTAIAAFMGFTDDVTSKELTIENLGQINDKLNDLTSQAAASAEEVRQLTEAAGAKQAELDQALADNVLLASGLAETTSQFEAFKASDAAEKLAVGRAADRTPDQIKSDGYLHNRMADENI